MKGPSQRVLFTALVCVGVLVYGALAFSQTKSGMIMRHLVFASASVATGSGRAQVRPS